MRKYILLKSLDYIIRKYEDKLLEETDGNYVLEDINKSYKETIRILSRIKHLIKTNQL